ncbi:MAG TPA: glycosyltransferase [bacterium]|nr:glycosyltransferase [bacterium]
MPKCSVITAIYNSSKFLDKCLLALSCQTEKDFELIISDDGSDEDISDLLEKYNKFFKYQIKYVKQQRNGIRKTLALNKGVLQATSDYLLFIDPDCLAEPTWVETHLLEREKNRYLIGRRVSFREKYMKYINDDFIKSAKFCKLNFFNIWQASIGNIKHFEKMLKFNNKLIRYIIHFKKSTYIVGCNFSCWRADFEKINGYNNEMAGLGGEDVELHIRFQKN